MPFKPEGTYFLNYFTCKSDCQLRIQPAYFPTSLEVKTQSMTGRQYASFLLHVSYPKEVNGFTLNWYLKMVLNFVLILPT
jgi:hypothetical protein